MTAMTDRDALVHVQYEDFPYPERDPADERQRLIQGSPSDLAEIRHYVFAGREPGEPGQPFRALIAGGGTGDAAIMLAQQCADAGQAADIVYLDLSTASRRVAEARAKVRGLTNLRFESGSLLDVARVAPGPYDYIDCCGVLHHLEEPAAGLAALVSVLKPTGGMGLMVYGEYGRRGVYETQALLRQLAPPSLPGQDRVALTRRLLAALPRTNGLARNPFVQDHREAGDAGLYDLLLHARDRAYRVEELNALVEGAGLAIAAWIEPARYDPATYLSDPTLLAALATLSPMEQAAAAEALAGNMRKHTVYAVPKHRAGSAVASHQSPDLIPFFHRIPGQSLTEALRRNELRVTFDGLSCGFPVPRDASAVAASIDGRTSLKNLAMQHSAADSGGSAAKSFELVQATFALLSGLNLALLRSYTTVSKEENV